MEKGIHAGKVELNYDEKWVSFHQNTDLTRISPLSHLRKTQLRHKKRFRNGDQLRIVSAELGIPTKHRG